MPITITLEYSLVASFTISRRECVPLGEEYNSSNSSIISKERGVVVPKDEDVEEDDEDG